MDGDLLIKSVLFNDIHVRIISIVIQIMGRRGETNKGKSALMNKGRNHFRIGIFIEGTLNSSISVAIIQEIN